MNKTNDKIIWKNDILDWCIYQQWNHFTTYTNYSKGLHWTNAPVEKCWKLEEVQEKSKKIVENQKKIINRKEYYDYNFSKKYLKALEEYRDFLSNL